MRWERQKGEKERGNKPDKGGKKREEIDKRREQKKRNEKVKTETWNYIRISQAKIQCWKFCISLMQELIPQT